MKAIYALPIALFLTLMFFNSTPVKAQATGEEFLAFAETMPEPVGGLKAIFSNVKYPPIAKKAGLEGKVYLLAMIKEDGSVKDVQVIKGVGGGCDEAAMEAVKVAKFTPGKNAGVPVKVKLSLAIDFKLGK